MLPAGTPRPAAGTHFRSHRTTNPETLERRHACVQCALQYRRAYNIQRTCSTLVGNTSHDRADFSTHIANYGLPLWPVRAAFGVVVLFSCRKADPRRLQGALVHAETGSLPLEAH
jgi:hypothetical protein